MRYSPVRHSTPGASSIVSVRLACVKHAASVQSEPESNSSVLFLTQTVILNSKFTFECFVFFLPPSSTPFSIKPGSYGNKTPAQTIFSLVIDPDVSGSFRSPAPWQGAHYSFHNPTRNPFSSSQQIFFLIHCFCSNYFFITIAKIPSSPRLAS